MTTPITTKIPVVPETLKPIKRFANTKVTPLSIGLSGNNLPDGSEAEGFQVILHRTAIVTGSKVASGWTFVLYHGGWITRTTAKRIKETLEAVTGVPVTTGIAGGELTVTTPEGTTTVKEDGTAILIKA